MRYYTFLLLGTAMILASCQKDEAEPNAVKPTNLKTEIEISNDNPGLVEVSATASNTNYYKMEFFTDEGSEIVDAEDGTASFTYQKSGTYAVITRAYASFEYFIQHLDSVTVDVPEVDPDPVGIPDSGYSTPMSYPGYNLVWNDEFEGTSLSSDWTFELGTGNNGWGNSELQYYREENAEVRDGMLVITAKEENFGGRNYTSSRIITQGAQSFQYGRIDIRAAVPYGQGIWPALWMLGDNFNTVGWPRCGEIDIMEMVGGSPRADGGDNKVFGTIHWDNNGTKADFGGSTTVSDSGLFFDNVQL